MYGHAANLLATCSCGAVASFRHDDTQTPCCRGCYEAHAAHAEADRLLRATDTATLLTKAYALTHQLHAVEEVVRDGTTPGDYVVSVRTARAAERAEELRLQRNMITAEVLRRADQ